ncbi:MAG: cobalamin biosynthesis protein CobD [Candidatus Omnitrophica bacterium]|nr:cobalamin biosynthesis protein CobD [Candidatus Omnitrophota bacterium]
MNSLIFTGAYILDLIFGDPEKMPHPVRIMGWAIEKAEGPLRKRFKKKETIAGLILVFSLVAIVFLVTLGICFFSFKIHKFFGLALNIILGYTTISVKSLLDAAAKVKKELLQKNLSRARIKLSHIVARDTNNLSEKNVIRAVVETVAENTTDGITAPLFYLAFGGVPLAMAYKAINTLDSMIGYQDKRYIKFGRAAAIVDEVVNFIPSRISALGFVISSWFSGLCVRKGFRFISRCALKVNTLNSTITEGVVASILGVRLGGVNYYKGKKILKPYLGEGKRALEIDDINRASKLAFLTSLIFAVIVLLIKIIW